VAGATDLSRWLRAAPALIAVTALAALTAGTGCLGSSALDLELDLPTAADLRPSSMNTITVVATEPGAQPIANTSVISGSTFSAGDIPAGHSIEIDVLLHDVSNRLVGLGQAPQLIDVSAGSTTNLALPVRRPFVYAADGSSLYSFDPSRDPRDPMFQGQLASVSGATIAVSVGGDRLVVTSSAQLFVIDTSTNMLIAVIAAIVGYFLFEYLRKLI